MVIPSNSNINTQASTANKDKTNSASIDRAISDKASLPSTKPTDLSSGKDSVSLSSDALSIANLEMKIANSSGVDRAKIDEIKASINEGTYRADADKIALAILEQEDLLG